MKLAELAKQKTLSFTSEGKFGSTHPNGCHIAEVEVDPETGETKVVSYCAVDDIGGSALKNARTARAEG